MDDFFSDFYTFLDNQTVLENDSFYIDYLEVFKMNQRQVTPCFFLLNTKKEFFLSPFPKCQNFDDNFIFW